MGKPTRPYLAEWVKPLHETCAPVFTNVAAERAADALLAVGAAFARISDQSADDFKAWGRQAWDRAWNLTGMPVTPSYDEYRFPPTLSDESEALADRWLATLEARRVQWGNVGSSWADEIASSQVASFALIMAARVLHRTETSYTQWLAALRTAWELNLYALEVSNGSVDSASRS